MIEDAKSILLADEPPLELDEATDSTLRGRKPRQPRWRSARRRRTKERMKRMWLTVYRSTGKVEAANEYCGPPGKPQHRWISHKWGNEDPEFKKQRTAIKEMWKLLLGDRLTDFGTLSLDVIELCLTQREDLKLAADIAKWQLKTQGIAEDKSIHKLSGPGGGPIPIGVTAVEIVPPALALPEGEGDTEV